MTETAPTEHQNLDAEEAVLGACLLSERAIITCAETVIPADFYRASHGLIYAKILGLFQEGQPVDPITATDALDQGGQLEAVGGRSRINELAAGVAAVGNVGHYARIVADLALMRSLVRAGQEITRLGTERAGEAREVLDAAEQVMFAVAQGRESRDFIPADEAVRGVYNQIVAVSEQGRRVIGLPTGFHYLDVCTSGLQPGNLVVVAARPSMGKSALALAIIANAVLREEVPVALFTLEMSQAEVMQRLIAAEGFIDSSKLRNGSLSKEEWDRLGNISGRLAKAPLHLDDSGAITAMEIRAKARRLKLKEPKLGLVVVDYIQLMGSEGTVESRQQAVAATSRALKVLARDLDVPILAVSQLSRQPEQRHDKRPMLSDLRESGAIEQDADIVAFLYRDEYYHPDETDAAGIAELNVAKHRNGPTMLVKLAFSREYTRFTDLAPDER